MTRQLEITLQAPRKSTDICANRHGGNKNSIEAFHSIVEALGDIQRIVFEFISTSPNGATCDEIERAIGLSHQTASARCAELKKRGLIIESGRRPTRSGRLAAVLTINKEGVNDGPAVDRHL